VVGAITPWNSPLLLTVWKLAPALAAGNTVVIKPSEHASVSMLAFLECSSRPVSLREWSMWSPASVTKRARRWRNIPGGTDRLHGVGCGRAAGLRAAAESFKRVSLELGGKSPHIIFEDADLDAAVKGVISGIFAAAGQTCMAGSRLIVHESIHDSFVEKLVERMRQARLGDPRSETTDVGPIATEPQLAKTLSTSTLPVRKALFARSAAGARMLKA
jgi:aldehyde dehydrogenase (NAD+)